MADVFYVDWDTARCKTVVAALTEAGNVVESESADGGRAWKRIRANVPRVLVISLATKPSHGRETARAVCEQKKLGSIKLVFVDGTKEVVTNLRKQFSAAIFTKSEQLAGVVSEIVADHC